MYFWINDAGFRLARIGHLKQVQHLSHRLRIPREMPLILGCLLLLLFIVGCAGPNAGQSAISDKEMSQIRGLLPSKGKNSVDSNVQAGVESLMDRRYKQASESFSAALRFDPQNSYVQFLNGLSYHLSAESGEASQYELAKTGYGLALKFNKNNWLAAKQLARLYLKTKDYTLAQEYAAYALLYQPEDAQTLYCLAQASYYAQDLETALGAIKRARQLAPDDPNILAAASMISAASGNPEDASAQLDRYKEVEPNKARIQHIAERIGNWLKVNETVSTAPVENGPASERSQPAPVAPDKEKGTPADATVDKQASQPAPGAPGTPADATGDKQGPRMVMIDVVMIRTEEAEDTSKGVNLLDGLALQFSDMFLQYQKGIASFNGTPSNSYSRNTSAKLSLADLKYNLNIFNVEGNRTEVLARPTLVALEGQKSTFFSGAQVAVAVAGNIAGGQLEKIDIGLKLEVTPKFVDDDTILIDVMVGRNFIEPNAVGTFKESLSLSKNEVSASVALKYGQTLILSGLREKETSEDKSGVPVLRDLPLLQYFFSKETTYDFHKSIITIITPRRVTPGVYISSPAAEADRTVTGKAEGMKYLDELKKSSTTLLSLDDNLQNILRHLGKHRSMREFREADLFDTVWYGNKGDLGDILKNSLTFMYY